MSIDAKMTPGPWEVHNWVDVWTRTKDGATQPVATVHDIDNGPATCANARAIAAVPELIAALELALPAVAMHTPNGARSWPEDTPHTEAGEIDLVQIARIVHAALAKAGVR